MLGLMPSCITMSAAEPREVSHTCHGKHLLSEETPNTGSLSAPHRYQVTCLITVWITPVSLVELMTMPMIKVQIKHRWSKQVLQSSIIHECIWVFNPFVLWFHDMTSGLNLCQNKPGLKSASQELDSLCNLVEGCIYDLKNQWQFCCFVNHVM